MLPDSTLATLTVLKQNQSSNSNRNYEMECGGQFFWSLRCVSLSSQDFFIVHFGQRAYLFCFFKRFT